MPFCILPLGQQDLILGRKWMSYFGVNPLVAERSLSWPIDLPPTPYFAREIQIRRQQLDEPIKYHSSYEADIRKRERAFAIEDIRRAAGRQSFAPQRILSR